MKIFVFMYSIIQDIRKNRDQTYAIIYILIKSISKKNSYKFISKNILLKSYKCRKI